MLVLLVTRQVSAAGTNTELNCMAHVLVVHVLQVVRYCCVAWHRLLVMTHTMTSHLSSRLAQHPQ